MINLKRAILSLSTGVAGSSAGQRYLERRMAELCPKDLKIMVKKL